MLYPVDLTCVELEHNRHIMTWAYSFRIGFTVQNDKNLVFAYINTVDMKPNIFDTWFCNGVIVNTSPHMWSGRFVILDSI